LHICPSSYARSFFGSANETSLISIFGTTQLHVQTLLSQYPLDKTGLPPTAGLEAVTRKFSVHSGNRTLDVQLVAGLICRNSEHSSDISVKYFNISRNVMLVIVVILPIVWKLKLKLIYDRQSVGQSVMVSGTLLGPATSFSFSLKFPSDICGFAIL
jgi:hypothetical protein